MELVKLLFDSGKALYIEGQRIADLEFALILCGWGLPKIGFNGDDVRVADINDLGVEFVQPGVTVEGLGEVYGTIVL